MALHTSSWTFINLPNINPRSPKLWPLLWIHTLCYAHLHFCLISLIYYWNWKRKPNLRRIRTIKLFDSTDLTYIMLMKARIFNPWVRSVVNSNIASRLFVFLFNSLIFYQFRHLSLLSQSTSLRVFTRSYRRIHRIFYRVTLLQFFLICPSFLFYAWRNYNISSVSFLVFHFRFVWQ